jgi:hypothetical protein
MPKEPYAPETPPRIELNDADPGAASSYLAQWRQDRQAEIDVIDAIQRLIADWSSRASNSTAPPAIDGEPVTVRFNADRAARRLQFLIYNKKLPKPATDLTTCIEYVCDGCAAESIGMLVAMLRVRAERKDLPALIGSEKQVEWANQIRLRVAVMQPESIQGGLREDYAIHWIENFKDVGLEAQKRDRKKARDVGVRSAFRQRSHQH